MSATRCRLCRGSAGTVRIRLDGIAIAPCQMEQGPYAWICSPCSMDRPMVMMPDYDTEEVSVEYYQMGAMT